MAFTMWRYFLAPRIVLLTSEGSLAPPDHGCECAADTGAELEREKLEINVWHLGTIELKISVLSPVLK